MIYLNAFTIVAALNSSLTLLLPITNHYSFADGILLKTRLNAIIEDEGFLFTNLR